MREKETPEEAFFCYIVYTPTPMETAEKLIESLNEQQREAVTAPARNQLILAGAGSGKTRVLAHRIAWLVTHQHVSPASILAVTFTNKAAQEMRTRIEGLLTHPVGYMWVGTFHSLAHRLLRIHWEMAKLDEHFQILDMDDQSRMVRRLQKELNLDESRWPAKKIQWFINKEKENGRRSHDCHQHSTHEHDPFAEVAIRVYSRYEAECNANHLVDFGELLLRSLEILQDYPTIADPYRQQFNHVLIDEFQDTNALQYRWLKQFSSGKNHFIAVGDDDQSIYGWRGACIDNIERFSQEFLDVHIIRLEQNYRSSQIILNAANAIIANNTQRLGKNLWTDSTPGSLISLYPAFNERDEAHYIAVVIKQWIDAGGKAKDIAILYRANAQSRVLEEQMLDKRIAYRIYGGLKFYERAEIKDTVAYLRLLVNPQDDTAFERIINVPTRGVGDATLNMLRLTGQSLGSSLWTASEQILANNELSARAATGLAKFMELINALRAVTNHLTLPELIEEVAERSGLRTYFQKDKSEKGLSRAENLNELINAATQFHPSDESLPLLTQFLAHAALDSGEEQSGMPVDSVNLMTIHAAKGLEFPLVFITGMEEQVFPHQMSMGKETALEEERRLCYVGITRAMQKLVLTYAQCRRIYGVEKYSQPSRFIAEIPPELIKVERQQASVSRVSTPVRTTAESMQRSRIRIGQRVKHPKFGNGTVTDYEGEGEHARLQIKFDVTGSKWLVVNFAKLETIK